ncbi:MAG: GPP34 family phosphoprotein, partial [Candidatus Marinimicrobia bacterium]|nr:GPP34 family phosphoprotein [Candidatus Neomarinimicrobiota bacterium]
MLNLLEELLLLALDDERGKIISSSSLALPYGLSGAILLEFSLAGKILLEGNKLIVNDNSSTGNEILDKALDIINSSPKQKTIKYWVSKLERKMKGLKKDLLLHLIEKEILIETENKILWVIPTKRYPTNNPEPENQVRKRIKGIVIDGNDIDDRSKLLISLVNSCSLVNEVFTKDERKVANK